MWRLTIDQIEEARVVVLANARALVEESELLLNAGRHARAYALAHLATEELAKIPMLVSAGLKLDAGRDVDWKDLNRRLLNHKPKISGFLNIEHMASGGGPRDPAEYVRVREKEREGRNRKKNEALYSHLHEKHFRLPSDAIAIDEAERTVRQAREKLGFVAEVERLGANQIRGSTSHPDYHEHRRMVEKAFFWDREPESS